MNLFIVVSLLYFDDIIYLDNNVFNEKQYFMGELSVGRVVLEPNIPDHAPRQALIRGAICELRSNAGNDLRSEVSRLFPN